MDASLLPAGATLPALPPEVPTRRYPFSKPIAWLVLKLLGWRYVGGFADAPRQVLIGWPHTSNWDGIVGLAAGALCGIRVSVLAKEALFKPPVGWLMRSFGGIPVERTNARGLVNRAVELFEGAKTQGEGFVLAIAPEGTRSQSKAWKTGFHRIAVRAQVPISVLAFDHGKKEIGIVGTVMPSGDLATDLAAIEATLRGVRGKHHDRATLATAGLASGAALAPPRSESIAAAPDAEAPQMQSNRTKGLRG